MPAAMGIFGSASGKQVDAFAVALAREVAEQCPPVAGEGGGRPAVPPRKLVATLEEVNRKAVEFKNQHKLGIYKKARLGNSFRWELIELGYDKRFAEDVTQRMVVQISRKS
jgi:hypothetical protein